MANTIRATQILDALQRAKKVGLVEESVTIAGCPVVFRNLPPEEYPAVVQELEDVPEDEYLFQFQLQNVSRALVEIDGQDLRNIDFIEEEVPASAYVLAIQLPSEEAAKRLQRKLKEDLKVKAVLMPPVSGEERTVQVPRHEWIRKNVLRGWGYEALVVAWRKATELRLQAEEQAKNGVTFQVPDETAEEKVRRLLSDLQEASGDIPDDMLDKILGDADLLRKTSSEELESVNKKLAAMTEDKPEVSAAPAPPQAARRRSIADLAATADEDDEEDTPAPPPRRPAGRHPESGAAQAVPQDVMDRMQSRPALNEQFASAPAPAPPPPPAPAQRRSAVPDHIRQAALSNTAGVNASMAEEGFMLRGRAAHLAALEAAVDETYAQPHAIMSNELPTGPGQFDADAVIDLTPTPVVDTKALMGIVNKPPKVGINPRFVRNGRK